MATTTALRPTRATAVSGGGTLTGTSTLLRFMLRRDRIRFPGWTLGLTLLMAYFATAITQVAGTDEDLAALSEFSGTPVGAMFGGPGFGFDDLTLERFLVGQYGLYIITGAGLMGLLTVVRHTRAEERAGRAELVRANVVGRHAQLSAALVLTALMAVVVAVLIGGLLVGQGYDTTGSFVFGASVGACAVAFAGIAAVTAQVSEYPRAAAGMAGAVLGAAFVLRALGDMAYVQDSGPSWLSWLSPIGWSQQTAPYTLDRWWPLLIAVAFAAATAAVGYRMSARRDVGAGLVPPRPGPPHAAGWLSSPLALAFRLQRASIYGWTAAVFVGAGAYGAFAQPLIDGLEDAPEELVEVMGGGAGDLLNGFLALMGLMWGFVVAVFAILAVQSLRGEESDGRAEPVLATAVSRPTWIGSYVAVTAAAAWWLLLVAGLGSGLGAAASTGDGGLLGDVTLGHTVYVSAVWLVLAIAALLYAAAPRALPVIWVVLVYAVVVGFFGPLLELPDAAVSLSPFGHVGEYPAEDIGWPAVAVLTALAAVVTAAAVAAFRRRDIVTTA